MEASFELFGLTGYRLGLCAACGVLALFAAMVWLGQKRHLSLHTVSLFAVLGMVLGIACARLLYCLVNLSDFTDTYENLWLTLRFFDGGLSLYGLLLGLLLAACLTAALTHEKVSQLLDVLCVPMGLLFCALFLGQQDTGLGIGTLVEEGAATKNFPWLFLCERMGVNVEYRMLVYLYQAAVSLMIALMMIPVYLHRQKAATYRSGEAALVTLALFGAAMTVLESLRDDGHMLIIFLRIGQVVSALLAVVCVIVLCCRYRKLLGKSSVLTVLPWVTILLFVAGVVMLEFALDGRLAAIEATTGQLYLVMTALCLGMAVLAWLLGSRLFKLRKETAALPQ